MNMAIHLLLPLILVAWFAIRSTISEEHQAERIYDYVIIGAGPSGLQMARFLQGAGRDYVVFERSHQSGKDALPTCFLIALITTTGACTHTRDDIIAD